MPINNIIIKILKKVKILQIMLYFIKIIASMLMSYRRAACCL